MTGRIICLLILAAVLLTLLPGLGTDCAAAVTVSAAEQAAVPEADALLYILVGVDIFLMTVAVILIGILANSLRKNRR